MINDETWIKLYRKLINWGWYKDNATRSVFIHLLLIASPKDKIWHGITIKKGQAIVGRIELSKSLGLSEQSVRTAIIHLKSTSEITSKQYNHFTLLTINNFDKYQQSTSRSTSNQPAINQQSTTSKEYKNIRNKEYIYNTIESVKENDYQEIATKYQVSNSFIKKLHEEMELYCGSTGKKYANYKLALMNWTRKRLDENPQSRLKDLRPDQIEDIRNSYSKLSVYKKAGYDVSRLER